MKQLKVLAILMTTCLLLCSCGTQSNSEALVEDAPTIAPTPEITVTEAPITTAPEIEEVAELEEISYDIIPEDFSYAIDVSINPYIRLFFDDANVINGVEYLNQDAINAYADLTILEQSMADGISELLDTAETKEYLQSDSTISLTLSQVSDTVSDNQMLIDAAKCVDTYYDSLEDADAIRPDVELNVSDEISEKAQISAPQKCTSCGGKGASCSECNGTSIVHCKRCSGGYETCGVCGGTGVDPTDGIRACGGCGGKGGFTCSWCGGALQHICPICWGENTCGTCGGDGYY